MSFIYFCLFLEPFGKNPFTVDWLEEDCTGRSTAGRVALRLRPSGEGGAGEAEWVQPGQRPALEGASFAGI